MAEMKKETENVREMDTVRETTDTARGRETEEEMHTVREKETGVQIEEATDTEKERETEEETETARDKPVFFLSGMHLLGILSFLFLFFIFISFPLSFFLFFRNCQSW